MSTPTIWYAEKVDLESIFAESKKLEKEFLSRKKIVHKGDYIYLPEELSDKIFFIIEGKIKIGTYRDNDKEVVSAILQKGDVFSELSILGEQKRKDFAIATENSEIVAFSQNDLNLVMKEHTELSMLMMKIMGDRVAEMENRLESLVFKDSRTRILEFIIHSVEKDGQRIGYEWVVRNFMTHQDVASMTSTSRQSVTTILNELRSENIIQFDRKRLLIRDLDKLKSLVK